MVQSGAGQGSALPDDDFVAAGAEILPDADAVFAAADMILKVKEPQPQEYERFREGQLLFTYLHLAADEGLTRFLAGRRVTAVAYETVQSLDGRLPTARTRCPRSPAAWRRTAGPATWSGPKAGRGVLMGGASGVAPAHVVVLGAGMAGTNAAWIAAGMEAEVTIVDKNVERLRFVDQIWRGRIQTVMSQPARDRAAGDVGADLVIGAVLVPGAKAPQLVSEDSGRGHAPRRGRGGHLDRPGWVLRDLAHDDALRPDLRVARCRPLLRRQHARRRPAHIDVRPHQRDDPVRARDREPTGWRTRSAATPRWRSG